MIADDQDGRVPPEARDCLLALRDQLEMVKHQILEADRRVLARHRASELSRRLGEIPGVGPLIATALVASIPDPHAFKSGRDLSAWIGLVPRQHSTGGKERLGHISQGGQSLSTNAARGRRAFGHPASQGNRRHTKSLAPRSDGAAIGQSGSDSAGQ